MNRLDAVRTGVFVLAGGARWEATALPALEAADVAVVKRCVDMADLMGAATTGHALVAVVDDGVPGFDGDAVRHLLRYDVRTVGVSAAADAGDRLGRLGVVATAPPGSDAIVAAVRRAGTTAVVADPEPADDGIDLPVGLPGPRRVITVWGPAGAPGRTTVAVSLAAARAAAGAPSVLVDLDPYGGAVAQHLGVLDEVSGVLAAARLANAGRLDATSFATVARQVADDLVVLTGLPRGDRRVEVRAGAVDAVVETASGFGDVVLDTGFCIEEDGTGPDRDRMTLDALASADEVVVVGSAEPTGLARLARGLVDLAEVAPGAGVHVVVNRMRASLGWTERDITGMVEGYVRPASMTFLPFDQSALDRASVAGRSLLEGGDSPLRSALVQLAGHLAGATAQPPNRR